MSNPVAGVTKIQDEVCGADAGTDGPCLQVLMLQIVLRTDGPYSFGRVLSAAWVRLRWRLQTHSDWGNQAVEDINRMGKVHVFSITKTGGGGGGGGLGAV